MATPIGYYTHHRIPVFSEDDAEIHIYPVHLSDGTVGYLQMVPPDLADRPAVCTHHPTYGPLASARSIDNVWPDPYARAIEDWEGSGGSFPSAWDAADGHRITAGSDLEHEDWGFYSDGRVGTTQSHGGLPMYPEAGTWFDYLFRFNKYETTDADRLVIRFGWTDNGAYEVEVRHNHGHADEIQLVVFDGNIDPVGVVIDRGTWPGETYQPGQVYRCAVYRGRPGETWRLELHRVDDDWSETTLGTWSGTTEYNYDTGGIGLHTITYQTYVSVDRIRRLPTNY